MKKSIKIATLGVAALGFAAAPVLGASAATDVTSFTDNLSVTVTSTCTYGTAVSPAATGSNYSGSGAAGALVDLSTGSTPTTVKVTCNDVAGYKITPTFSGLNGTEGIVGQSIPYAASSSAGSASWTAYYTKNSDAATAFTAGTAITGGPSAQADSYSFSYKVGLGTNQPAGTYTGTAKYDLAVNGS